MVTVQDIGLQLTKPVRELAQWNFPFAQTLEQYCSLFNTTCNKSFGEAGLVVQNSTAVYVHRIDSLWTKIEYCRNVLSAHEQEEATKSPSKKRDRKTDACFHKFKTINFAEEVDKNIDIKKNHDSVKTISRRFAQLEKGIAQHVSVDIYDVNGEIIGKKYDFRCNQNISMDGILVDEFAPQDFCCDDDVNREKSSLNYSCDSSALDSAVHDDDDENVNTTYAESERDDESPEEETSDLATSLETSQQNLSLSTDIDTDNTLVTTPTNITSDNCGDVTVVNTPNQGCPDTPTGTNSPIITNIDNTISSNNNDSEDQFLNNNIKEGIDVGSLLDSPPESVNSKGRRTSSIDDLALLNDTNGDLAKTKSFTNSVETTLNDRRNKMRQRSTSKSTQKLLKRKVFVPSKRRQRKTEKNLNVLKDPLHSRRGGPNMFKKSLNACMKCIREYDPSRYEEVTNADLDFLGFRLHVNTEPDTDVNDNARTNEAMITQGNDDATPSFDEEISEPRSPCPMDMDMSSPRESFCDVWFRSDSPHFLPETVDKWHEMIQPKLLDAEQRSTFCIRDYASRIIDTLKASGQRKISFDTVIEKERPYEVARYFLASLDLASKQNVDINEDTEYNIELALHEENRQCPTNSQADSHD